jgi:transaldolase
MPAGYFHRVAAETGTRLWINNPTAQEVERALEAGAIGCTTNPTYCARLLDAEPDYIAGLIAAAQSAESADAAAEEVYRRAARRLVERFTAQYEASGRRFGYVTIQGDPRRDGDPDDVVQEGLRYAALGPSLVVKVQATGPGAVAIGCLVERNVPICATGVFALAQAVAVCEAYQRAVQRSGNRPPLYVTHITGIFDEYLAGYAQREGRQVAPEVLRQAGWIVAQAQHRLMQQRGYPGILLGGGARGPQHFTDMVGGDVHVTIGWNLAEQLTRDDPPATPRLRQEPDPAVVAELNEKLPDFRRAYDPDAMQPEEFAGFGPCVAFRAAFLAGYGRLVDAVAARQQEGGT